MLLKLKSSLAPGSPGDGARQSDGTSLGTSASQEVQTLAARLRIGLRDTERCVAICGLRHDDGAGRLAADVAVACLPGAGDNVLLLDTDVSRPLAHLRFGLGEAAGLCDWLGGSADLASCIHAPAGTALRVMPLGSRFGLAAALFASSKLAEAFATVRAAFDRVVVSVGEAASGPEGLLVADQCDALILAVRSGRTRNEVDALHRHLRGTRARVLGAVLMTEPKKGVGNGRFD